MKVRFIHILVFVVFAICFFLPAQQRNTGINILKKSGKHWILNKGSSDGVKNGMKGNFWIKQESGGKSYNVDTASFKVIRVENKQCYVLVEEIGAGFSENKKYFQWATFNQKLNPPKKSSPKESPKKVDISKSSIIPSGKPIEWHIEMGEKYYNEGKYKLAESYYKEALKKDSEEPGALIGLQNTQDKIIAIEKQKSLISRKNKRDGYIARGNLSYKKEKFNTAIAYFISAFKIFEEDNLLSAEKILTIYKKNKDLYLTTIQKGSINLKTIYSKSLELAEKYINEGNLEKTTGLISILKQSGYEDISKKTIEFEKKIFESRVNNHINKGNEALRKNNLKDAESFYLKARELSENDPVKSYRLEEVKTKLLDIKGIKDKLDREGRNGNLKKRAEEMLQKKNFDEAVKCYEEIEKIDKNRGNYQDKIRGIKNQKSLYIKSQAIKNYDKLVNLAESSKKKGTLREGLKYYTEAYRIYPEKKKFIVSKILNILETSEKNFEDVIKSNFSKEEYNKFLNLLLILIKGKYLNTKNETGLNLLLKLKFARDSSEYEILKNKFEANIFNRFLQNGDKKFREGQYKNAERIYNLAAKIRPNNAVIKQRIKRSQKKIKTIKEKKEPKVIEKKKVIASGVTDYTSEINNRLKDLTNKDLSPSEKVKISEEITKLIEESNDPEAFTKIFDKYSDEHSYLKSLKFQFYKKLINKFKNTDPDKYFKYFESYMKHGWIKPKDKEDFLKNKIKRENGILTFDEARKHINGKISKYYKNEKKVWEIEFKNGMKFIFIPAGNYRLQLKYVFVESFFIGKYEITNRYYETFCQKKSLKFKFKKRQSNYPVTNISWDNAKMYCLWLSEQIGLDIDLPTETQWEKSASSGNSSIYFWGNKINRDYLWFWGNSGFKLHEVGKKLPNHWGIQDILGNAGEFTKDWFAPLKKSSGLRFVDNPEGPKRGTSKVVKGGGWYSSFKEVTIPFRGSKKTNNKDKTIGFRIVINLKPKI